jgi:hypothetical protein
MHKEIGVEGLIAKIANEWPNADAEGSVRAAIRWYEGLTVYRHREER